MRSRVDPDDELGKSFNQYKCSVIRWSGFENENLMELQ